MNLLRNLGLALLMALLAGCAQAPTQQRASACASASSASSRPSIARPPARL